MQEAQEWVTQVQTELRVPETAASALRTIKAQSATYEVKTADLLERCRWNYDPSSPPQLEPTSPFRREWR